MTRAAYVETLTLRRPLRAAIQSTFLRNLDLHAHRVAAAQAEGRHAPSAAPAPELVRQGEQDARPRGADGVAQGHGAAVDVELVVGDVQLLLHGAGGAGEGLVVLEEVDV